MLHPQPITSLPATPYKLLRVVTASAWVAEDFATAGIIPVKLDYGFDPPPAGDALWCAGSYANRCMVTDGVELPPLAAPDHQFTDRIPAEFLSRRVVTRSVAEWRENPEPGHGFVKLPLMKQALFPASEHPSMAAAIEQLTAHYQATDARLVEKIQLQHSGLVDFAHEYRCFIADGQVTAASLYLETVRAGDGEKLSEITWQAVSEEYARSSTAEAIEFAAEVISRIDQAPAGYTLDVGQLTDGSWAVVEPNASWSSNPYHANPAGVVTSILASQRPGASDPMFDWAPEAAFLARVNPLRDLNA